MNKNTLIGLLVIGVILFGFSWYNNKQYTEKLKEQQRQDSIALAQMPKPEPLREGMAPAQRPETLDSLRQAAEPAPTVSILGPVYDAQLKGTEEFYTIENELYKLTFSNKGGRIAAVELKDYKRYNGQPLMLFQKETHNIEGNVAAGSTFNLTLWAPHQINTADFYFTPRMVSDSSIAFRLYADSTSYLEYLYTVRPDNYLMDMRVDLSHFKGEIAPNQTDVMVDWNVISPQQEKGFDNENNYTTLAYKYPGESSIEELGMSTGLKEEEVTTKVQWVAFKQQFFSSILVAEDNFSSAGLKFNTFHPTNTNIKDYTAQLRLPYSPSTEGYNLQFYFGPNKFSVLKKYGDLEFQKLVPLGWWIIGWINRYVVIPVFDFLGSYIANFGIVILILTVLIKLVIFPLTYKSYLSTARMRLLKPDIDKLNEKYPRKEDAIKKQQAMMQLYRSAGVNPMGGCLPLLIQFPILIAMFRFFPASIELRGKSFLWADDLSSYDSIWNFPDGFSIPFYGDHVSLFALLMAISLYVVSKMNYAQSAGMSNQQMPGMKFMMLYLMPILLLVWFNNYSAGLCYYYLLANIITMGQTFAFRYLVDDKKLHAQMMENSKKPAKKSKWQMRLEEMQRQQEAMRRQQQQRGGKR
ncbi:MAG TPA: membrane protein insertase YidC [Candidatus Rikenella faecigallinarum]|uniref:Membrane protein insertase YidC n=1 Tax=Candidatus Rikenella faecigallinarum TaxID=2838745 RepID=A0A9D1QD25_9BACT|nr:membrane protein insertase YidC [Candidatus Rikenella faecigallinarum]